MVLPTEEKEASVQVLSMCMMERSFGSR